jgi:uncharacterized protein
MAVAQKQEEYLFDADSHVLEPPDMWDNYLDAKFKDRAIRIVPDAGGIEQLWVDGEIIMRRHGHIQAARTAGKTDLYG